MRGQAWPEGTDALSLNPIDEDAPAVSARWLAPGIAYLAITRFDRPAVYEAFRAQLVLLQSARTVVLDLRENSGGNDAVAYQVLAHFLDRPAQSLASRRWIYDPALRAGVRPGGDVIGQLKTHPGATPVDTPADTIDPAPAAERITAPLLVLTGHHTVSAAEDFLVALAARPHRRLGETTAGSTGEQVVVALPGGGFARLLSKLDRYPDGRDFVGVGIAPDLEVTPGLEDLRSRRDVVLDRALAEAQGRNAMADGELPLAR